MKLFAFTAVLLLTICMGAVHTPSVFAQTGQPAALPNVTGGPILEYVSDHDAVIAWTSKGGSDMQLHFGTAAASLTQTADATENSRGTNHRVKLNNLQPSTTYYIQMSAGAQPVGSVITFQTVAKGAPPNRNKVNLSH